MTKATAGIYIQIAINLFILASLIAQAAINRQTRKMLALLHERLKKRGL